MIFLVGRGRGGGGVGEGWLAASTRARDGKPQERERERKKTPPLASSSSPLHYVTLPTPHSKLPLSFSFCKRIE